MHVTSRTEDMFRSTLSMMRNVTMKSVLLFQIFVVSLVAIPEFLLADDHLLRGEHEGTQIRVQSQRDKEGETVQVILSGPGLKKYSYFQLDNPARVVVDFSEVQFKKAKKYVLPKNNILRKVRMGQHEGHARVVLDLSRTSHISSPSLSEKRGSIVLSFRKIAKKKSSPISQQAILARTWGRSYSERPIGKGPETAPTTDKGMAKTSEVVTPQFLEDKGQTKKKPLIQPDEKIVQAAFRSGERRKNLKAPGVFKKQKARDTSAAPPPPSFAEDSSTEQRSLTSEDLVKVPYALDADVIYFSELGEAVTTVRNQTSRPIATQVLAHEIVNPGKEDERRVETVLLSLSPTSFLLSPGESREVVIRYTGPSQKVEQAFEITFSPQPQSFEKATFKEEKIAFGTGISVLGLLQPRPRKSRIRWDRTNELIRFSNEGNISALFHSGEYCKNSGLECFRIPTFRIHPGNSFGIPLEGDVPLRITQQLEMTSREFVVPAKESVSPR